ncbi:hypothetical protein [Streptomyces sp. NPDC001435]|uniref:hypothetical protein n=1 Tax=unclassified Streptomyces TaxID=2593676 RepID=UPI0036C6DC01
MLEMPTVCVPTNSAATRSRRRLPPERCGSGSEVGESLGEWDLPLHGAVNQTLHRAMQAYLV